MNTAMRVFNRSERKGRRDAQLSSVLFALSTVNLLPDF
jgi:hypothetical protein